jgi:large subunit ribosomal protein L7/L12
MAETETNVEETKSAVEDLTKESQKIIESIETMTVLELSKLVKALEDKFGVVAAAPVALAGASPVSNDNSSSDSGDSTVSVILTGTGDKKIQVLKAVREATGLGLKEAKEIVDNLPKPIKEDISKEEAEELKKILEEQGGQVEIK